MSLVLIYFIQDEGFQQDSYMYQTVGTNVVQYIANAMQKPLIRKQIKGTAKITALDYKQFTAQQKINDEVEDLFQLIKQAKQKYPDIQGVSSGAIMSTYQKLRVQDVCNRLGLKSLAYLWQRDQTQLLKQMIDSGMQCVIIKIASYGLFEKHLNKSIKVLFDYFQKLKLECGMNVCGQGGEFQSLTLDCSLFKKSIEILEYEIIYHDKNQMAPVAYLKINKLQLKQK